MAELKTCALEGCGETFTPAPNLPHKRWCSTRCQQKGRTPRDWSEINRERIDKRTPEQHRERGRRWREANPDKVQARNRAYHEANREKERARNRAWREANPEKRREQARAWREKNREKLETNRAAAAAYARDWRKANPDKTRFYHRERRARKLLAPGIVSERDWKRLVNRHRGLCAYCGTEPYAHMDHVVPLSRGGRHSIGNVLPACSSCNLSKSSRLLVEWRQLTLPGT